MPRSPTQLLVMATAFVAAIAAAYWLTSIIVGEW
jgi:hypothetical protein